MPQEHSDYVSYLLRLWRNDNTQGSAWRASLESPLNRERLAFANLRDLFTFLETQTGQAPWPEHAGTREEH
jgi:hypothetical protein